MTPNKPIKGRGDGRPIAFPNIPWRTAAERRATVKATRAIVDFGDLGACPYANCPRTPRGTGELCDNDHCRELKCQPST